MVMMVARMLKVQQQQSRRTLVVVMQTLMLMLAAEAEEGLALCASRTSTLRQRHSPISQRLTATRDPMRLVSHENQRPTCDNVHSHSFHDQQLQQHLTRLASYSMKLTRLA